MVETDIANCFSAIPQDKLMQAVEERISDRTILTLVRAMLRAGVSKTARSARGHRNPARGSAFAAFVQRIPAPAGPGVGYTPARGAGALLR